MSFQRKMVRAAQNAVAGHEELKAKVLSKAYEAAADCRGFLRGSLDLRKQLAELPEEIIPSDLRRETLMFADSEVEQACKSWVAARKNIDQLHQELKQESPSNE